MCKCSILQGTRILDQACDIAADGASEPINLWAAVEQDVVGYARVRWMAQLLFKIAVFSAWLSANAPRLRYMLQPFIRAISGIDTYLNNLNRGKVDVVFAIYTFLTILS